MDKLDDIYNFDKTKNDLSELFKYFPSNDKLNKGKDELICFVCDTSEYIIEDLMYGNMLCQQCGQVLGGIIDTSPEWKHYDDADKSNIRCGGSIDVNLPQSSLGTTFSCVKYSPQKKIQGWISMPYDERTLYKEFVKIKSICEDTNIANNVIDDAKNIYRIANGSTYKDEKKVKPKITRGKNRISINAACLFYACCRNEVVRTPKEIATLYGINDTDMNKGCKKLLELLHDKNNFMTMGTSKPSHFIKRFCDTLKIKKIFANEALKIALNTEKLCLASKHTPYSTAASCILLMIELFKPTSITKQQILDEFKISDITINKTYKELEQYKNILISDEKTNLFIQNKKLMETTKIPFHILERMKKFNIKISDTK
jgi:transcription initiation factor TFIIIB Brf1 subunit/transcription initiation factor TFIIB